MTIDGSWRIMAAFVLHAAAIGGLFVRLPEIQLALGLSEGVYGLVQLAMPVGALLGSQLAPGTIDRQGAKPVLLGSLPLAAALQVPLAFSFSAASLAAGLFVYGVVFGTANVAINVEAARHEAEHDARIMSRCHGWWALGFLLTSLAAASVVRLGLTPVGQFAAHALAMAVLVPALLWRHPAAATRPAGRPARRFAIPGRATLLIGTFALAGFALEAVTRSWAVIYVRDTLGAADWLAAYALPAVVLTQTLVRFTGDNWVKARGVVAVARTTSVVLLAGVVLLVIAPTVPVAILGCLLIGAGIAIVPPQAIAACARLPGRAAAEHIAAFSTLTIVFGFFTPTLFGGLAEWIGLRYAMALLLPLPLLAFALARVLDPPPAD